MYYRWILNNRNELFLREICIPKGWCGHEGMSDYVILLFFPAWFQLYAYWIEHVAFRLLYAMFRLSIRIFYRAFQALQLIVLGVFGDVDQRVPSCMLVRVLEIEFETIVGL